MHIAHIGQPIVVYEQTHYIMEDFCHHIRCSERIITMFFLDLFFVWKGESPQNRMMGIGWEDTLLDE